MLCKYCGLILIIKEGEVYCTECGKQQMCMNQQQVNEVQTSESIAGENNLVVGDETPKPSRYEMMLSCVISVIGIIIIGGRNHFEFVLACIFFTGIAILIDYIKEKLGKIFF